MSLGERLNESRQRLRPCSTLVTYPDGSRYLDGKRVADAQYGFVEDIKPDNVPARIAESNLYVGSQDCCEPSALEKHGITFVLSVGVHPPPDMCKDLEGLFVPCLDVPDTDLGPVLDHCLPVIRDRIRRGDRVLVHCNAGVSRSCAVAVAYLMQHMDCSFDEAMEAVKKARPAARPNDGFLKQLRNYR